MQLPPEYGDRGDTHSCLTVGPRTNQISERYSATARGYSRRSDKIGSPFVRIFVVDFRATSC